MKDVQIDELLHIQTTHSIISFADRHHNAYEPTDYEVLDQIIQTNLIHENNTFIDFGCGKGRVALYMHYMLHCKCIGIEFSESIYNYALINLEKSNMDQVQFLLIDAREYDIPKEADCFYFFNPFSLSILRKVIYNILESYYAHPRQMYFFFYYPTAEYIHFLLGIEEMMLVDEIDTNEIYHTHNQNEAIFIFAIQE